MLFGGYFGDSIVVLPEHDVLAKLGADWHGVGAFMLHGLTTPPFWLAIAGVAAAYYCYLVNPALPGTHPQRGSARSTRCSTTSTTSTASTKWFFGGGRAEARNASCRTSATARSSTGSSSTERRASSAGGSALLRHIQSGYVYHYAFTMIVGVFALLDLVVNR